MSMQSQRGFTLIELMIAVAVIAVLVALALPNYQGYLTRTVCEDAKGVLAGAASTMERFRAQNNTYIGADLGAYSQSPVDGAAQFTIELRNLDCAAEAHNQATSYCLLATPIAGGRLNGRGTLILTSAGERDATGDLDTADVWNSSCRGL